MTSGRTERPNVILIVLDCTRADHLSCYGYPRATTPFLDEVAHEGVRFQQCIATAPWTLPSHASLLTGLFPSTHGATDENRMLAPRHRLLPESLKAAGYATAAFCTNPWVSPQTGFGRGFDRFHTQRVAGRFAGRAALYARKATDRVLGRHDSGARRTNRALFEWLEQCGEPFFAFVHYNETHLRFHPPAPYDRRFMPPGITGARIRAVNQDCNAYIAGEVAMSEEDFVILTALYDGELCYADMRLREIAAALQSQNRWDRTLFIVTADHGEHLGEHQMMSHKFVLYDTLLHIPLLMRCPPHIPRGFVVDELTQPTDIVPTVLRLAGLAEHAAALPGRALLVDGHATPGPAFTISERFRPNLAAFQQRFPRFDTRRFNVRKKAIRTRREKYIWHSDEANEFYDLARDPGEEHNRIAEEPERAEALRRQLFDWVASVERFEADGEAPEMDALMRQQLERLGYIE
jgi:arylsulfatase A-like enzyme